MRPMARLRAWPLRRANLLATWGRTPTRGVRDCLNGMGPCEALDLATLVVAQLVHGWWTVKRPSDHAMKLNIKKLTVKGL